MNWRRGILLAAINLSVALPPIISLESIETAYVHDHAHQIVEGPPTTLSDSQDISEKGPTFGLCDWIYAFGVEQKVVVLANMPAAVLTGWGEPCPANWTLSGMLHTGNGGWAPTPSTIAAKRKADIGFLILVALQWVLVGGFPLRRYSRPWREPGMFITICATLSVALAFVRPLDGLAKLFAICAVFAWFWLFIRLVWKFARSAWTWAARRLAANTI